MTATQEMETIQCRKCGENMELMTAKKHTGIRPVVLMIMGVFCIIFIGGALIGIPLLLLGVYQYTAKHTISYCSSCGYYFKVRTAEAETD